MNKQFARDTSRIGHGSPTIACRAAVRTALEDFQSYHQALGAIVDLLSVSPADPDTLSHVSRGRFSRLIDMLHVLHEEGGELADGYAADGFAAMADLIIPDAQANVLSREHLAALLHIVREREDAAIQRVEAAFVELENEFSRRTAAESVVGPMRSGS